MKYPDFYDSVESIKVVDPLSKVLGAFENGEYEFTYTEIVKSAGHSCPTVAGAYMITQAALKALYPDSTPVRGGIRVAFEESLEDGVAGVISNVVSHITGATDKSGFKGLQGQFARHSLMNFNADIDSSARFTRVDNNKSIDVTYNPQPIEANPKMFLLMKKMTQGQVDEAELKEFGILWQDRVKRIFENIDTVIQVEEV